MARRGSPGVGMSASDQTVIVSAVSCLAAPNCSLTDDDTIALCSELCAKLSAL